MIVYSCLSTYRAYKDRYRMFASMCEQGAQVRLVIYHDDHPPAESMPSGLRQLVIPRGTNFITRRKHIRRLMNDGFPEDEQVVLHDTFIAEMALHRRRRMTFRRPENVRNVLSMYAATSDFLLGGQWRGSHEHRVSLLEWPYYWKRHGLVILGEILSCQLVDCVVGNSMRVIDSLEKYYHISPRRLRCIAAEVDSDFYNPGPSKREELGLPKGEKIILYAGHYQRLKGIDVLLKAFDIYAAKNHHVRLVMVGDINDTGNCWFGELLNSLPNRLRIDIREKVPQDILRDYYRSCDLFVTASHHEGSPRVVKEAIACGLPVVAGRIEGNLAIDPDEQCLVLLDDWQPQTYAEAFERVLDDDGFRRQRIEAGLRVAQNLSPRMVAARYMELYKSLFQTTGNAHS